jgi:protein-S-isoprenylcysteine O-methyltransferase Ste14
MPHEHGPWWTGSRGEWFVVAQLGLMALVFFGPRAPGLSWRFPFPDACRIAGIALTLAGAALMLSAGIRLGRSLTPLPFPRDDARLATTGAYALVRHPMYGGGLILCLGWVLWVQSWLTLGYALALFVLLDAKSRREERWLMERFPAYDAYRRRVRKLIPFVY